MRERMEGRISRRTSLQRAEFVMHGDTTGRPREIRANTGRMFGVV